MDSFNRLPKLSEEANDELEALFSIYNGDISMAEVQPDAEVEILMQFKPRTADCALNSFVMAEVLFSLPFHYPAAKLTAALKRTSGFGDDGRALDVLISRYLMGVDLGEPVLMNLFELVFDFVDDSNEGECLICNESLKAVRGNTSALRTNCYHCFHIHCLCRWGVIQHISALQGKVGTVEWTRAASKLKSLEGDIRSHEEKKRISEQEIQRLDIEIERIEKLLTSQAVIQAEFEKVTKEKVKNKNNKTSFMTTKGVPVSEQPIPRMTNQKEKKGKGGSTVSGAPVRNNGGDLAETDDSIIAQMDENELRQMGIRCHQYRDARAAAVEKIDKLERRIISITEILERERSLDQAGNESAASYPHEIGIKCPFCTTIISEETHAHVASALRQGLEAAMNFQMAAESISLAKCKKSDSKAKVSGEDDRGGALDMIAPDSRGASSVLLLPPSLVELVRSIQNAQAELKSRLHYSSATTS